MVEETIDPCCDLNQLRTGCLIMSYLRLVGEIALGCYMALITIPSWIEGASGGFKYFFIVVGVLILLGLTVSIIVCIILLVGLHKNRHEYVVGYIGHAKRCILVTFIFCVRKFILPSSTQDFTLFRISFILLLLQGVFLLMICSYSESMGGKLPPATTAAAPALAPVPALAAPVPQRCSDTK